MGVNGINQGKAGGWHTLDHQAWLGAFLLPRALERLDRHRQSKQSTDL